MAQITEKKSHHGRQQQTKSLNSSSKHSHHIRHHTTNENAKQSKGIEILDFHESWLEEVEIYKDKMVVCQKYPHHHYQHLGMNHIQFDSAQRPNGGGGGGGVGGGVNRNSVDASGNNNGNVNSVAINSGLNNVINVNGNARTTSAAQHTKRRSAESKGQGTATHMAKPRIIVRGSPKSNQPNVANIINTEPYKKVQMLLKRARDDAFAKHASNSKRLVTQSSSHKSSTKSSKHSSQNQSGNDKSSNSRASGGNGGGGSGGSSIKNSPSKSPTKIVVNTFHGSSLLSAHQHVDDKSNFLTQNGLTKSAANALETSLYASLYAGSSASGSYYNNRNVNALENSNYLGITFNKAGSIDRHHHHSAIEDDPCAAIDEVNGYEESDSEEDYIGSPFYLEEDGSETHQSRNIRIQINDIPSKISMQTTESDNSVYLRPTSILSASLFPNVPPYLNFTSHADKGPNMPPTLHRVLKWKLSPVMPKIVKRVVLNSGFRIIKNTTDWMAVWEKHMKSPGFRTIRSHQKYNHIPGSFRIGRKDTMWRSIHSNMKKYGRKEFGFMQKSYIMPDDLENLRQVWPKNASKLTKWIVKPPASARGTGIRIVNKWSQFPKDRPLVVQKYIERPLLINDNKFDMRLYVVLTSINPLRIYMYKDGLARFASVKYSSELGNLDERCMHLTNYSINKFSQNYSKNEDFNAAQGHKWTLQSLWACLENRGINTKRLWATLRNLVIKAIISGESGLNRMYRQNVNFRYNCFELFGFDVLLDENIVPWLLEINISPSLHSELPLDLHVKGPLIQAVLNTALYQVPPKLNDKQQREILEELKLKGPLCHDKRIFTTCLTAEEVRKHNQFTNRSIEFREEYVDIILDNLLPDDVRCLLVSEDELARCKPLERIFPTADTHIYLRFVENARYYNRLLDAWEQKYSQDRSKGINVLKKLCLENYHLQVSDAAMEKEPNVALTEIDMLHVKKDDILDGTVNLSTGNLQLIQDATKKMEANNAQQSNIVRWRLENKQCVKEATTETFCRSSPAV